MIELSSLPDHSNPRTMPVDVALAKQAVRERIWSLLDERRAVEPPGAAGHIPSFVGADVAAARLTVLEEWRAARVIKANPDQAQLPVRILALRAGKLLYMAVPKLAAALPFYQLDGDELDPSLEDIASSRGAAKWARMVSLQDMSPVDLIVSGSVVVNHEGVRIGKGAGYADIEVGLLAEAGLVGADTTIVTTVHDLQVVDESLPETEHDFGVDIILTPSATIHCPTRPRPGGVYWDHLDASKIAAIPVLTAMHAGLGTDR